jgi:hypothetical protein
MPHVIAGAISVADARVVGVRLFRIEQGHARERSGISQIGLVPVVPVVNALDDGEPASIVEDAGELGDPRPHPVGRGFGDPELHFGFALHRVLPAIRLLDADTEDPRDRPLSHDGAELLGAPAVRPRRHQAAPGLVIGELDVGELGRGLHVGRAIGNEPRRGSDAADARVPVLPQLRQAGDTPFEKGAARGIAAIRGSRQGPSLVGGLEVRFAVHAEAIPALRRPAVREHAVHVVLRDDLAVDAIHELEVVGTERARDPQFGVGPMPARLPRGRSRDPVRMRLPDFIAHGMRIDPRHDVHVERAATGDQHAERVRIGEPRAAMMEGDLGRVIRDDPAGAQGRGVGVQPAEVVQPEFGIESAGVVLDQRELDPPHGLVEPARISRRSARALIRTGLFGAGCEPQRSDGPGGGSNVEEFAPADGVRHGPILSSGRSDIDAHVAGFREVLPRLDQRDRDV